MVFPWLVIGASAALESARRNTPKTASERQVRKLKDVEHSLRERQKELASHLEEAVTGLAHERESHETDKQKLTDLSVHIQEIENRMVELQEMTDGLIAENEQLKVEKTLMEEETRHAQKENQELRQESQLLRLRNTELEDQIDKLARDSELEVARVTDLLEGLKSEVADALTAYTTGGEAIEFQGRMEKLGIKLDCNLEDLQQISRSQPARQALGDAVTTQFNNQMGLVMEDRSRLEHLMGIAQNLKLKGFGGGILSAISFTKDSLYQDENKLAEIVSSIPSAADMQPFLEQHAVEKKMQSLQVTAASEEAVVSGPEAVLTESVPKAQKTSLLKFRFKGLQEPKKTKAGGIPSVNMLQGDDGALCSSELVLK